jgi:hypothetical protein
MFQPIKPGTLTERYAQEWLRIHRPHVKRFIHSRYIMGTMGDFEDLKADSPSLAVELVYDSIVPNDVKKNWVKDFLSSGSNIIMVLGDKDEGKNALAYLLLEWYYDMGIQPYIIGAPQKKPDEFERVYGVFDSPPGSVLFIDELGQLFNARDSGKGEQKDSVSTFNTIRHQDKSAVVLTQLSALGDVNFLRLADMIVLKPMSLFGMHLERDVVTKAVSPDFLPMDKTTAHFFSKQFRFNLNVGLSRFWKEEYSTPFKQLTHEEALEFACELYNDGLEYQTIVDELKRHAYRTTKEGVENMLQECGIDA